ncbi:MAG: hypothetical protein PHV32_04155 [Eubacteriales bacterium]|nr:hypothetical protein [Eubacteriales bacterium]
MKRNKYATLTEYLVQSGKESVGMSFEELNKIISVPAYAYTDRPSWANCTTKNATSFQRGWMGAGYRVSMIDLGRQRVEFTKNPFAITMDKQPVSAIGREQKAVPTTVAEELLLTVPEDLTILEMDEYLMVRLNKYNSDIVDGYIAKDPAYQSKGKAVMDNRFRAGDYSTAAFYEIVNRIATENSTRTSKETMQCIAAYCADSNTHFLDRVKDGDHRLVDDLLQHLVKNGNRKDKSLASKVCRYLNEWLYGRCDFTINDSVVRAIMPYYLAYYKIDKNLWYNKNFEELSYFEFYQLFSAIREHVMELNNHQLDHLIWYAYKNDSIRTEVATALARTL